MPIWEIEPVDPDDRNWRERSIYRGRAVIRAESEERARQIAKLAFDIAARVVPGEETPLCPWGFPDMARAQRLEGSGEPEGGPEAILEPAEYDDEWRR